MNLLLNSLLLIHEYVKNSSNISNDQDHLENIIEDMKKEIIRQEEEREALKKTINAYRNEKDFFLSAMNALPYPIFIKNEQAEFVFFNDAYKKYFHISDDEYIGKTVLSLDYLPIEDREIYQDEDLNLIQNGTITNYTKNFQLSDETISATLYWSCGFRSNNSQRGLIGSIVDITAEKNLQAQLGSTIDELTAINIKIEKEKMHDSLTSLYNRYGLSFAINSLVAIRKDENCSICVLFIDLDCFKCVNDIYGHLEGDKILVDFSNILKQTCRENDILIRYGGEEFLAVLVHTDLKAAKEMAERIRSCCASNLTLPDNKSVTVSIGVVKFRAEEDFEHCLLRVDSALYEAKKNGRNQIVIR